MSMFDEQQYQYYQQTSLLFDPNALAVNQHGTGREKTPTDSLINHTGLSPIPLTATPPLSRNPSRPPELPRDQPAPDQMLWDDGSMSNSPTSVRTPDGESFEVEMLDQDMRTFYQHNGVNMSTQASHNAIPALDTNMFFTPQGTISNHGMSFECFHFEVAKHAQFYKMLSNRACRHNSTSHSMIYKVSMSITSSQDSLT